MRNAIFVTLIAGAVSMFGAEVAGTVSAERGMSLNGQVVPVAGTKSWPVAAGDELKSTSAPLVLKMKDGSRIVLGKNSQAKLEAGTLRLLTGTMQYELADKSTMQVAVKGDVLQTRTGVASTAAGTVVAPVAAAAPVTIATEDLPPPSRRKP